MSAPLVDLARVEALFNAAELKRNHQHQDGDKYEGEWTIIPTEDFRRLRAAREAFDLATVTRLAEEARWFRDAVSVLGFDAPGGDGVNPLREILAGLLAAQEENARLRAALEGLMEMAEELRRVLPRAQDAADHSHDHGLGSTLYRLRQRLSTAMNNVTKALAPRPTPPEK